MVKGSPLTINVIKMPKTDVAIWYNPKPVAPILRDKKILKINPSNLVKTEKTVTVATALKIDFIACPFINKNDLFIYVNFVITEHILASSGLFNFNVCNT